MGGAGFEPANNANPALQKSTHHTQNDAQDSGTATGFDLDEVVRAWPGLAAPLKAAIVALVRAANGES